ncbi:hypothetical protein [Lysinibacillus boronitolerans]|uniref:Uncharacterized protein n=1 Tax=Lysinibacillus boronitolerans JCM 21713 = 10a = NBRC 103108 TaxID=1294264 RepID=A0ABR4Y4G4_9BACI|nr:hypothetical protein [Lysinibacillus boronitolerans]KGR88042.1 hypothetical protein CD31_05115 [Lysinibacillus boronitolerans JCM 21713 = 10a = NBRC 103108]
MKNMFRIITVAVLLFSISLTPSANENALASEKNVVPGFYIKNELVYNLKDFQASPKKDKKKIIKDVLGYQTYLVLGNQVYDFQAAAKLPAGQNPKGVSISEYEKINGELKQPNATTTFKIISIE